MLIYDTFEDSLHHKEASELLDSLEGWIIPLIVIYEFVWFLRGLGIDSATALEKVGDYVLAEESEVYQEGSGAVLEALRSLVKEGLSLGRFNDEVILSVAITEDLPLATFDGRLRSKAKKKGIDVLP